MLSNYPIYTSTLHTWSEFLIPWDYHACLFRRLMFQERNDDVQTHTMGEWLLPPVYWDYKRPGEILAHSDLRRRGVVVMDIWAFHDCILNILSKYPPDQEKFIWHDSSVCEYFTHFKLHHSNSCYSWSWWVKYCHVCLFVAWCVCLWVSLSYIS